MAQNILGPVHLVSAASMASSVTSKAIKVLTQDNIQFQLVWTGSPTGNFVFQSSLTFDQDGNGNILNVGNWDNIPVDPAITAAGAGDTATVDITETGASFIRVFYIRSSGTGTLDVFVSGKGI